MLLKAACSMMLSRSEPPPWQKEQENSTERCLESFPSFASTLPFGFCFIKKLHISTFTIVFFKRKATFKSASDLEMLDSSKSKKETVFDLLI